MFLAIVVPPARKNRIRALLVLVSMAASWAFPLVPFLAGISGGMKIIILTVLISAVAAVLFPVHEEQAENAEKNAEASHE